MVTKISHKSLITEMDRAAIWHPFTQMQTARPPIPIVKAKGLYLYDEEGNRYIDGISSWWVNLHGHGHPYIAEQIRCQAEELEHVIFADFTHLPAVELATRLLKILPGPMSKIFYTDNGSTAIEAALKMALQYWKNIDPDTKRSKIICFSGGYHGDTFGAMSAAGKNELNKPFWSYLFDVIAIPPPVKGREEESLRVLHDIVKENTTACFIYEPLILGSGGMVIYPAGGLNALLEVCKQYGVLTIADEVMTGFGRTGPLFASEKMEYTPDLICLSKGLTGGYLPLGATACTQNIFEAFLGDSLSQAFLHGHSYAGNPIACRSALASLDLLEQQTCTLQRMDIASLHAEFCEKMKNHPMLKRCESLGTILALEYCVEGSGSYFHALRDRLYRFFLERGILLRPLGNVLYVLPPYCITAGELKTIYDQIILSLTGDL